MSLAELPTYEVFAIRYATRGAQRKNNFIGGDPHDAPMPMDYFVWLVRGEGRAIVVDTGFGPEVAAKRGRTLLRTPAEGLALLDVDAREVRDVVITHLHYDHVGTFESFPAARFHLQDDEMAYATGRHMRHRQFNHGYEVDEVVGMVRLVYKDRVSFHDGSAELAPGLSLHRIGGHTHGLQCVRVHTRRGWVVLASDASHYYEHFEKRRLFTTMFNLGEAVDGYATLERLAQSPRHIVPGHDPLVMRRYPAVSPPLEGIAVRLDVEPVDQAPRLAFIRIHITIPRRQDMKPIPLLMMLAGALCAGLGAPAAAQDYPARPVQVLVAFPAGGSADIVGRHVMQKLSEVTGGSFVIENRTGAGGNIAFAATAAAKPDGYTLLFSTPGIAINPSLYKKANYKLDDFTPIALIGEAPLVLLANPTLPIKSVSELVEAGKRKPDAIRFASSGNGSSSHLAMDVLRSMTGMQYLHIPYRGGGPAMLDVIAGQVDVTMLPISESMPYVRDGRLRALGQTGARRSPIAPDMPTIEEGGVKGYSSTTWYMVLGPANLPRSVVSTLQSQLDRVLKAPDLQEKLKGAGVSVINGNSEEANAFLQSEYKKWAALIKASGTVIE